MWDQYEVNGVFDEMRTCALLQKVARTDGQAMTADDCLAMGTSGGGQVLDLPVGKPLVERLEFLQAGDVRLLAFEPSQQVRQARLDAVDVEGGDLHRCGPILQSPRAAGRRLAGDVSLSPCAGG